MLFKREKPYMVKKKKLYKSLFFGKGPISPEETTQRVLCNHLQRFLRNISEMSPDSVTATSSEVAGMSLRSLLSDEDVSVTFQQYRMRWCGEIFHRSPWDSTCCHNYLRPRGDCTVSAKSYLFVSTVSPWGLALISRGRCGDILKTSGGSSLQQVSRLLK